MSWRRVRPVLSVAVMALVAVSCGSGSGSGADSSSVSRPSQAATLPEATARPPATNAPPEAATTEAAAPAPAPATTQPAAASDDGSPWWPWVLAALAVVAVVIGVIALLRRSPTPAPPPTPVPPAPAAAVLAQSDEITTHLVGLPPGGLGAVAGADANRLAALITMVEQLVTSAPDETSRRALASLHEPMRSLHGALDSIALTPNPTTEAEAAEIRGRAAALHSATSLARATLYPPPPGSPV